MGLKMRPTWWRVDNLTGARRSAPAAWDALLGHIIHAGLETISGDNLVLVLNLDGEGVWIMVQHRVGAIIGRLRGRDDSAVVHPDQEVRWELVQQLLD